MDGKQLLIPLRYNLECTIQCPGSPGCHQSNIRTRSLLELEFRSSQIEYLKISLETFRIATYCFPELSELLSVLFIIFTMADIPVLCLVPNRGGSMALVFEGRSYKLKYTGKQKKCWRCSKDKKGCKGAVWTDLEVTAVINRKDHVETCQEDEHLAYKMEKKALLSSVVISCNVLHFIGSNIPFRIT
ncbi:hypothetical protein T03_15361 [Trichinella britovi]|uniref:FLYWCH-type domain-containing protein n=1 Tax=Trichinella britovi TaxID=45882 RepID=A0A0V1C9H6_TRIBR|nr:hypothetical protein T03_15361 [Trichinella britovi]